MIMEMIVVNSTVDSLTTSRKFKLIREYKIINWINLIEYTFNIGDTYKYMVNK